MPAAVFFFLLLLRSLLLPLFRSFFFSVGGVAGSRLLFTLFWIGLVQLLVVEVCGQRTFFFSPSRMLPFSTVSLQKIRIKQ